MILKFSISLVGALFSFGAFAQFETADLENSKNIILKLGEGQTKKSLVALPSIQFLGNPQINPDFQKLGIELYEVIQNDLLFSTFFQIIPSRNYLEDPSKTTLQKFDFDKWRQIGTEFLVRGGFKIIKDQIELEIYAYDVAQKSAVVSKKYLGNKRDVRRLAHTFSNDFVEALSGQKAFFLSKFVVSSDRSGSKTKEIYLMDWDARNLEQITFHKTISFSPNWSPDGKSILYSSFAQRKKTKTRNPDLFLYELASKKLQHFSYRIGMNTGAHFMPDGKNIILTLSQGNNADIYRLDLDGEISKKLTQGPLGAMNVEPSPSPIGDKIAFSTDRSGNPMIYVMDKNGGNPERITFAGKYNASPAWSPDGKKIAFAGWEVDHFDIFIINADKTNLKRITQAKKPGGKWSNNEDPVFSPDGRFLIYTSDRYGPKQILISNLDGSEERRITQDSYNYFRPKWSKNLD